VASGDTTANSTVLWTLAPAAGQVTFDFSTDPGFNTIAGSVIVTASDPLVPVKASIAGLGSGTQYYYRATDSALNASSGVFRTSLAPGTKAGLRFGVSGDWRGELAPYPAVANVPARNLEFFHALGDTVYADVPSPALNQPQATTLADFRTKHREVYTERYGLNTLAALRQSTSLLVTYDDHEVTDDFAGAALASSDPRFAGEPTGTLINQSTLFNNGLTAFHEYHPIRNEIYGAVAETRTAGRPKLYRNNRYGDDAVVITLDARSFRDEGLPAVASPLDPTAATFKNDSYFLDRTMLGRTQLADLKQDLVAAQSAGVTWKFVMIPEPIQNLGVIQASDRYEGYARERADILRFIKQNDIQNVVFVAADIHGTIVNNLTYEENTPGAASPEIQTGAFEITTGPVAYDAPFGPTVVAQAVAAGLITPAAYAAYLALDRNGKDQYVKALGNTLLQIEGYDPIGIESAALTGIDATLLAGDYVSLHDYGWTEFEIDPATQRLVVTTYGIEPYTAAQLATDAAAIVSREPIVLSQFTVMPVPEPATWLLAAVCGTMIGICRGQFASLLHSR
jgi:phosphodiesterase/alkaline phosphatase D-like protein